MGYIGETTVDNNCNLIAIMGNSYKLPEINDSIIHVDVDNDNKFYEIEYIDGKIQTRIYNFIDDSNILNFNTDFTQTFSDIKDLNVPESSSKTCNIQNSNRNWDDSKEQLIFNIHNKGDNLYEISHQYLPIFDNSESFIGYYNIQTNKSCQNYNLSLNKLGIELPIPEVNELNNYTKHIYIDISSKIEAIYISYKKIQSNNKMVLNVITMRLNDPDFILDFNDQENNIILFDKIHDAIINLKKLNIKIRDSKYWNVYKQNESLEYDIYYKNSTNDSKLLGIIGVGAILGVITLSYLYFENNKDKDKDSNEEEKQ